MRAAHILLSSGFSIRDCLASFRRVTVSLQLMMMMMMMMMLMMIIMMMMMMMMLMMMMMKDKPTISIIYRQFCKTLRFL